MRERAFVLLSLIIILVALVGLNAASYVRTKEEPDSEDRARRTTFNAGATGTKAFYDFLRETGRHTIRWQQRTSALLEPGRNQPSTLFIIGETMRPFEDKDIRGILSWTEDGGTLVVIDREPNPALLPPSSGWKISAASKPTFIVGQANSDNVNEMTSGVTAAKPVQPSIFTSGVNSVMPSKYAAAINIERDENTFVIGEKATPPEQRFFFQAEPPPPPTPKPTPATNEIEDAETSEPSEAPLGLLASGDKTILVDYPYGAGRIVYLSDPYIVSNGGIALVDNLQLALNLAGSEGVIAFDEYHQGYGASGHPIYNYFENTPIPAMFGQFALLIALLIYSKGKRFARPVPLPVPDRRSKLEYVSAMAELQRRARTYDLAIENIYSRIRRELARFAGVDNTTVKYEELAARVAERSKLNREELETVMRECEDAIHGAPVNDKKALSLVAKLREIEEKLNLRKNAGNLK
ncbi:MAG: DUF4350 domain-containing protein [Acidobacteriota bacterium]|nr:DUF4350 domain-containing protein [Acidobacteriota bacterium]